MVGNFGAVLFFLILAVMIARSPEAAYKAMTLCFLGLLLNRVFVPKSEVWTVCRLALPWLVALRFSIDLAVNRLSMLRQASFTGLLVFVTTMSACSLISGWFTQIALLKLALFLITVFCVLAGTTVIRHRGFDLCEWFVSVIVTTTVLNMLANALNIDNNFRPNRFDDFGNRIGSLYNGVFVHPNCYAIYGSMFIAYLLCVLLFGSYRHRWVVFPLMACWSTFIIWSKSRTGAGAVALLVPIAYCYNAPLRDLYGSRLRPLVGRGKFALLLSVALIVVFIVSVGRSIDILSELRSFMVKTSSEGFGTDGLTFENITSSRRGLINLSLSNFRASPFTGIGFGVSTTDSFIQTATWYTAPAEKGFLPTAILEEGGVVGFIAFLVFITLFFLDLSSRTNYAGVIALWTFLVTNFGEVTVFSAGGAGTFGWLMLGAAIMLGEPCWTRIPARTAAPLALLPPG